MISDAKSAHYIAWTELGTSFVVSNVGEFSRSILGSHFKHNNFSSFVRQLNMYGFHKINRTPRAQRTSTDAQTWEFSHHKFLRGRPDLLDEIKRKALEPDPAIKHRVELPGEVRTSQSRVASPDHPTRTRPAPIASSDRSCHPFCPLSSRLLFPFLASSADV
ncbi:Heat shock factor protein [Termitomyces sp. J132]|nr:Heat shock factor protein [Termitomyces sp. J132]